jgi:precorrin-8X/cobalt-precorrin-8 methylmutase
VTVHPIEAESYRRMHAEVDFSAWSEPERAIVARMVHGTADPGFAATALVGGDAVRAGVAALRSGAAVLTDAEMVRAGMPRSGARCYLGEVPDPLPDTAGAGTPGATRSAAAVTLAAAAHPRGAVWVIGNAPTALFELLRLHAAGLVEPALVIGLPVGWVGAAESKAALWDGPLRAVAVTNRGRRGGSAVAASAFNALARLARAGGAV